MGDSRAGNAVESCTAQAERLGLKKWKLKWKRFSLGLGSLKGCET